VQLLPAAADRVAAAAEAGRAPAGLATAARMAVAATADLHRTLAGVRAAARPAAASFELAGQYEICFAMAACLHLWEAGHRVGGITNAALWEDALWTRACLRELTGRLGYGHPAAARARADMQTANRLVDWLAATVAAGEGISIFSAHRPAGAAATISNGSRR
jgi:hypothetical protein